MYNKKYILKKIEEFHRHNTMYDGMEGCVCYPAYFRVGHRGWFLYEGEFDRWPHRVHTSIIQEVLYEDNRIIVRTENTRFTFEVTE